MPAVKCGGCAKFLSPIEAAKCRQCSALYHRVCVNLPAAGVVGSTWRCPECLKNQRRDNRTETPVRGGTDPSQAEEHCSPEELMDLDSSINKTALDATANISRDLTDELRLFKEELRTEFRLMHVEFQELRAEMAQIKESLRISDERIDTLETRVGALEHRLQQEVPPDRDPLENTIAELKCQLNERDQELLLNDIEVTGIPESKDESTLHLVQVLAIKLGVDIDERDVVHAERVGSTRRNRVETSDGSIPADPAAQRPRCISVRFARRATRDTLLRAARVRRGLSAGDLNIAGPPHRVYVNERLTRANRQLFYHARQAGSQNKWKFVWTREGKILARREDGQKAERIRCEDDICRIFG